MADDERPFPWPLPENLEPYLGDPDRQPEQQERFKDSHNIIREEITWPINEGNPFTDWGHFRMSRNVCRGELSQALVYPELDRDRREEIAELAGMFELKDWKDGSLVKYSILEPDPDTPRPEDGWPVVISSPGTGGIGAAGLSKSRFSDVMRWATPYYREHMPAVVVALHPQVRTVNYDNGPELTPAFDAYLELIEELASRPDVDRNRISIQGHSMGATSIWALVRRRPKLFSAAVPCAGTPLVDLAGFKTLTDTPFWMLIGHNDPWIGSSGYTWAYARLLEAGHEQVRYWEIQDIGHHHSPLRLAPIHQWMWSQRRDDDPNCPDNGSQEDAE
ncbi:MAG: prolyl oligopeptidase family serine peptidase [Phycisphaerae bacterium]